MTNAAVIEMSARRSTSRSAPEIGAVTLLCQFQLLESCFSVLTRHRSKFGEDVDERVADTLPHRLRPAHVDVRACLKQPPDERAFHAQAILHMLAPTFPGRDHVDVVEHTSGGELLDLVAVDV